MSEIDMSKYELKKQTKKEIVEEYVKLQLAKCGVPCKIKRTYIKKRG